MDLELVGLAPDCAVIGDDPPLGCDEHRRRVLLFRERAGDEEGVGGALVALQVDQLNIAGIYGRHHVLYCPQHIGCCRVTDQL